MTVSVVFIDMDNTIMLNEHWEDAPAVRALGRDVGHMNPRELQAAVEPDKVVVMPSSGNTYVSRIRPGARELIKGIHELVPQVCILSHAKAELAKKVMKAHGLEGMLDGIYGRDTYRSVPKVGSRALLIDDERFDNHKTIQKLHAFGAIRSIWDVDKCQGICIQVPHYKGEPDDNGLDGVLELVRKKIHSA